MLLYTVKMMLKIVVPDNKVMYILRKYIVFLTHTEIYRCLFVSYTLNWKYERYMIFFFSNLSSSVCYNIKRQWRHPLFNVRQVFFFFCTVKKHALYLQHEFYCINMNWNNRTWNGKKKQNLNWKKNIKDCKECIE